MAGFISRMLKVRRGVAEGREEGCCDLHELTCTRGDGGRLTSGPGLGAARLRQRRRMMASLYISGVPFRLAAKRRSFHKSASKPDSISPVCCL